MACFSVQLKSKGINDFKDGIEAGAALAGKRLVKTFSGQACIIGNLGHTLGACNVTESLGNKCSISIVQGNRTARLFAQVRLTAGLAPTGSAYLPYPLHSKL